MEEKVYIKMNKAFLFCIFFWVSSINFYVYASGLWQAASVYKPLSKFEKEQTKMHEKINKNVDKYYYSTIKKLNNNKEDIKLFLRTGKTIENIVLDELIKYYPHYEEFIRDNPGKINLDITWVKYSGIKDYFKQNEKILNDSKKAVKNILPIIEILSGLIIIISIMKIIKKINFRQYLVFY
jgi:hypothetical protein